MAVEDGTLDAAVADLYDCPVSSWNDGEAAVAAEELDRESSRPLVVLKLGTSVASGISRRRSILLLPFQLSKAIPGIPASGAPVHPIVGIGGTLREIAGAEGMSRAYRMLTANGAADYSELCQAVEAGDATATEITLTAARSVAKVMSDVARSWGPLDLVVTGKNVESETVYRIMREAIEGQTDFALTRSTIFRSQWDVDLSTAVGACVLSSSISGNWRR